MWQAHPDHKTARPLTTLRGVEPPYLPGYEPDTVHSQDFLTTSTEADSLARLIASRTLAPPFSLGLFGGPGSGKSFLAKVMMNRVWELSRRMQRESHRSDENIVSPIIQVELNAWYSAGVSPWIILAERIYDALRGSAANDTSIETQADTQPAYNEFLINLPTPRQIHDRLQTELRSAEAAVEEASREHEGQSTEFGRINKSKALLESTSPWPQITNQFNEQVVSEAVNQIDQDGKKLGLPQLSQDLEVLYQLLEDTKTVGGRAGILTNIRVARRYFRSALLIVLAILLAGLAGFFGYYVLSRVGEFEKQITTFFAGVAGVSALVGAIGVLLTGISQNQAARALQRLQTFETTLSSIRVDLVADHNRAVSEAGEELDRLRRAIVETAERLASARRSATIARSHLVEFRRRPLNLSIAEAYRQYDSSLKDSITTDGPSSQTSLQLMIRSDMEHLSMLSQEAYYRSTLTAGPPESDFQAPARILVYVDDLDRCDPSTMVAYLQAIQHLLGFPLFAVIVLVDPRRLSRALRSYDMLDAVGTVGSDEATESSDVTEYLAKLFQFHLWMKPVTAEASLDLASQLNPAWSDEETHRFQQVARVLKAPSHIVQLARLFDFARLLQSSEQVGPIETSPHSTNVLEGDPRRHESIFALLIHLAVLTIAPALSRRFVDAIDRADRTSTVEQLQQDLHDGKLLTRAISELLDLYSYGTNSSTAMMGLQRWIPLVRRLLFDY
jgi:KAP family P-loop domain